MAPIPRHASGELVRAYASAELQHSCEQALVADGGSTRELLRMVALLAPIPGSVLICGETGTGKTLVARELHRLGTGRAGQQRVINCAALPDALLADTLWELDAAEAAQQGCRGRPCTVLLDEVGELSPWGQALLLRKVLPSGQSAQGTRFLAATHRDLGAMARAGSFSRELLARLSVHRLNLVPLRARREEIAPLALHFLRLALVGAEQHYMSVEASFVDCLESHDWPGNLRELKNAMVRAVAVCEQGALCAADLPDTVRAGALASLRRLAER